MKISWNFLHIDEEISQNLMKKLVKKIPTRSFRDLQEKIVISTYSPSLFYSLYINFSISPHYEMAVIRSQIEFK